MTMTTIRAISLDVLHGVINAIIALPVSMSFTSIIYRDPMFEPMMPTLVKLVVFSCVVHQLSFSVFSSLPFAVGQVQDAGLIFLSAMVSSIVASLTEAGQPERILPTCLFTMSIATTCLGVVLVGVGRLKLASLVQYIPMPVIGGYLAYIGYFCFVASVGMMAGVDLSTWNDWMQLNDGSRILRVFPGVVLGVSLYNLLPILKSPLFLPVTLIVVVLLFYIVLWISGSSLESVRDAGWVAALTPSTPFYALWSDFSPQAVDWSLALQQTPRFIAMTFVVGFSSCLDVAAIEMESSQSLDFNNELQTVGISNIFSGVSGGVTGSYIFTQTIFSLRQGVTNRWCGFVVAMLELTVVFLPVSILSFVPKFIFGSLLVLIAADLMTEWLIHSRKKMNFYEFLVCVFTFLSMIVFGVQMGLLLGVIAAMTLFVFVYANATTTTKVGLAVSALQQSRVARSYNDRLLLLQMRGSIVRVKPNGYIFFGSAIQLLAEIKKHIRIAPTTTTTTTRSNSDNYQSTTATATAATTTRSPSSATISSSTTTTTTTTTTSASSIGIEMQQQQQQQQQQPYQYTSTPQQEDFLTSPTSPTTPTQPTTATTTATAPAVRFVVIDFSLVVGVDATAARSCFRILSSLLQQANIVTVYSCVNDELLALLQAHQVIPLDCNNNNNNSDGEEEEEEGDVEVGSLEGVNNNNNKKSDNNNNNNNSGVVVIPDVDDALEWCEDCLLLEAKMASESATANNNNNNNNSNNNSDYFNRILASSKSYAARQSVRAVIHNSNNNNNNNNNNEEFKPLLQHQHSSFHSMHSPHASRKTHRKSLAASSSTSTTTATTKEEALIALQTILCEYLLKRDNSNNNNNNNISEQQHHQQQQQQQQQQEYNRKHLSASLLSLYFERESAAAGAVVFRCGDVANKLFVIAEGALEIVTNNNSDHNNNNNNNGEEEEETEGERWSTDWMVALMRSFFLKQQRSNNNRIGTTLSSSSSSRATTTTKVFKMSKGSVCGEAEFFLKLPHSMTCYSLTTTTTLWTISSDSFDRMQQQHPLSFALLQQVLINCLSIANVSANYQLFPSSQYTIVSQHHNNNNNNNNEQTYSASHDNYNSNNNNYNNYTAMTTTANPLLTSAYL